MAKLQIALDFIDLKQALEMANKVAPYCHILEAGTPLIKSVGIDCVRQLKEKFPNKLIFADLKTMDAGEIEVNLAASSEADIVSVMAAASDKTIKSSLLAAQSMKISVLFDLMGVKDKVTRAKELENLGAKYIHIHTGLDEQVEGQSPFETLEAVSQNTSVQLTVAGGINSSNIAKVLAIPKVDIVMIGSAITKSDIPEQAAQGFWNIVHKNIV